MLGGKIVVFEEGQEKANQSNRTKLKRRRQSILQTNQMQPQSFIIIQHQNVAMAPSHIIQWQSLNVVVVDSMAFIFLDMV